MPKKKQYKGYPTLKEARAIARERAANWYVDIFRESDGSYSVGTPCDQKAVFVVAVDKSGAKYKKRWVRFPVFGKREEYVPTRRRRST